MDYQTNNINFFEKIIEAKTGQTKGFSVKKAISINIAIVLVMALATAVLYFRTVTLNKQIKFVESIQQDPEFLKASTQAGVIAGNTVALKKESDFLTALEKYANVKNTANVKLINILDQNINNGASIKSIAIAEQRVVVKGDAFSVEAVNEAIKKLYDTDKFTSCDLTGFTSIDRMGAPVSAGGNAFTFEVTLLLKGSAITE